jgi:hypothetical protein
MIGKHFSNERGGSGRWNMLMSQSELSLRHSQTTSDLSFLIDDWIQRWSKMAEYTTGIGAQIALAELDEIYEDFFPKKSKKAVCSVGENQLKVAKIGKQL